MRIASTTLASFALCALAAGQALAQGYVVPEPQGIQRTAYESSTYYNFTRFAEPPTSASPSDKPGAASTDETPAAKTSNGACQNGNGGNCCECKERPCRWCACGKLPEPWTLQQDGWLKKHNIKVGGWVEAGYYTNAWGDPSNGPIGLRNVGDGPTMDQLWLFVEKATDTKCKDWDWGFRMDYLFGADAPDTQAYGDQSWDYGWFSSRDYGSAIPQAYATLAYKKITVKAGHFYTPIGNEVVQATGNFFYSHSYAHTYGEPFTHTGVVANYKFNDKLNASLGWVDGWDGGFANYNGASMILAGFEWKPNDKNTVNYNLTAGNFGNGTRGGNNGDLFFHCIVWQHKLSDKTTYVFEHDYGYNTNLPRNATSQWYGIVQYLTYKMNDCWSVGGRFEWFDDPDGARVGTDAFRPGYFPPTRVIANPGSYFDLSVGVNWKPHSNLTIRPEIRYDWFDGTVNNQAPFNRGQSTDQLSGGFDVILTW